MKTLILFLAFFSMLTKGFNQQIEAPKMELTKQEYLKKNKNQKVVGAIFLGGGASLVTLGLAVNATDVLANLFVEESSRKSSGGNALIVAGIISIAGSIPLFISASANKRKAISLSVKNQPSEIIKNNRFYTKITPSLTFKINL